MHFLFLFLFYSFSFFVGHRKIKRQISNISSNMIGSMSFLKKKDPHGNPSQLKDSTQSMNGLLLCKTIQEIGLTSMAIDLTIEDMNEFNQEALLEDWVTPNFVREDFVIKFKINKNNRCSSISDFIT